MSSPLPLDPYEALGVARTADIAAIRSAHRKLALKFHPDRIKDEAEKRKGAEEFQKAQQAYELLSDDKKRQRYDDQVKLAALKKEAMMNGPSMRSPSYPMPQSGPPPRTTSTSTYEYAGKMYEERRPRYSDDDDRYAEPLRSSARKAAPVYERRPSSYEERKPKKSAEKASSTFGFTSSMEAKLREKARQAKERASHQGSARDRDRERRRDSEDKFARRRAAYVESDSSTDSESTYRPRRPEPTRRQTSYEDRPRSRKQSPPPRRKEERRPVRDDSSSSSESDDDDEWANKHKAATQYISQRGGPRPSVLRSDSAQYYASPREKSAGRKSGSDRDDRRDERTRSSKSSRPIEIVEPPRRDPQGRKPPSMKTAKTSPADLKGMTRERDAPQPHRSATGDYPADTRRPIPSLPRSNTMPVPAPSRKDTGRSSKLKHTETQDSGYGSSGPGTPEHYGTSPPKNSKTSRYFIVPEDKVTGRTISAEEYPSRRTRSPSPPPRERDRDRDRERDRDRDRDRKRPDRPSLQTHGSSFAPSRSSPYTMSPDQMSARPNLYRNESSRVSMPRDPPPSRGEPGRSPLYREVPKDDAYTFKPEKVNYAPKVDPEKVKYVRRGTSDAKDKDHYPGSTYQDNLYQPRSGRRESIY